MSKQSLCPHDDVDSQNGMTGHCRQCDQPVVFSHGLSRWIREVPVMSTKPAMTPEVKKMAEKSFPQAEKPGAEPRIEVMDSFGEKHIFTHEQGKIAFMWDSAQLTIYLGDSNQAAAVFNSWQWYRCYNMKPASAE